ncbi:hypothetical protein [Sorangium cellulosum]|uniref:Uncharacterized protein n=1 Tax=Sorangium cellulosum TaxID=56 RepID=A0A150QQ28_SORCE|nr:hypothetical protein [Sorangium cellulosum]KYF70083.1 hypothetical protein BE15_31955 [Sorangium cellulosum]
MYSARAAQESPQGDLGRPATRPSCARGCATGLLGCGAADLDLALEGAAGRAPARVDPGNTGAVLHAALEEPRPSSVVGWPGFVSLRTSCVQCARMP